jgi:predicted dehydrogenase
MGEALRVGFVGAGLIATFHSKMLRASGGKVERAGVFDPDLERAQRFALASGHTVCSSEDEVLDGCDAVYVCTWTSEHARLVDDAARRGLAIFCEKPLAINLSTARRMADVVRRASVTNQVGLILRRSPAYLFAHQLITAGDAGRLMAVTFRDDQYIPIQGEYASTWRADPAKAGAGTLLEHSIHDIDMLHYLGGPISTLNAHQANFHGHTGIEDVVSVNLRFATGALATLTSVWHDNLARPSLRRVELFGERRHVVIDGDDWFGPVSWTDCDGRTGLLSGDDLVGAAAPLLDGPSNPDVAFVNAASAHQPAWPDFAMAVDAHRVVDAIYRSASADGASVAP